MLQMPFDYLKIIELLSCDPDLTVIPLKTTAEQKCFSHRITQQVQFSSHSYDIIYLHSTTSVSSLLKVRTELKPKDSTVVIKPSSLKISLEKHLGAGLKIFTPKIFLSKLLGRASAYQDRVGRLALAPYIEPSFALESERSSIGGKGDKRVGSITVILASPGHGKTYYTKNLAAQMAKNFSFEEDFALSSANNALPLYVNSSQWKRIPPEMLRTLWKALTASFKYYDLPIHWLDGNEHKFLQTALGFNLFNIIFDGFDEYVLQNNGKISANNALRNLSLLARDTGSDIIITSRTTFWENAVSLSDFELLCPMKIKRMRSFSPEKASEYFKITFETEAGLWDRAAKFYRSFYAQVADESTNSLIGKGITLKLIADIFLAGGTELNLRDLTSGKSFIPWMMWELCQREIQRQDLELVPEDQVSLVKKLAMKLAAGEAVRNSEFSTLLQENGFPGEIVSESGVMLTEFALEKLSSHPVIYRPHDHWKFRNEQLFFHTLAEMFLEIIEKENVVAQNVNEFVRRTISHNTLRAANVAIAIVEQIISRSTVENAIVDIKNVIRSLISFSCGITGEIKHSSMSLFATMMALQATARLANSQTALERTALLKSFLENNEGVFECLYFNGEVQGLSFVGEEFKSCVFSNVKFISCNFAKTTVFDGCSFSKLGITQSDDIVFANMDTSRFDRDTVHILNSIRARRDIINYTAELLRHDLRTTLDELLFNDLLVKEYVLKAELIDSNAAMAPSFEKILSELVMQGAIKEDSQTERYVLEQDAVGDFEYYFENSGLIGSLGRTQRELLGKLEE